MTLTGTPCTLWGMAWAIWLVALLPPSLGLTRWRRLLSVWVDGTFSLTVSYADLAAAEAEAAAAAAAELLEGSDFTSSASDLASSV